MRSFLSRNKEILAFVILALITGIALRGVVVQQNEHLIRAQHSICLRANATISESNARIKSHKADTAVLEAFILSARRARLANYKADHHPADLRAVQDYTRLARELKAKVRFHPIPPINCQRL